MWTDGNGFFYFGDMRAGDRAATEAEVVAWNAARAATAAEAQARPNLEALIDRRATALEKGNEADQLAAMQLRLSIINGV